MTSDPDRDDAAEHSPSSGDSAATGRRDLTADGAPAEQASPADVRPGEARALALFESRLRRLSPRGASVERDELMYRAGFAAGQAALVIAPASAPRGAERSWAWPLATLAASVLAAAVGLVAGANLGSQRQAAPGRAAPGSAALAGTQSSPDDAAPSLSRDPLMSPFEGPPRSAPPLGRGTLSGNSYGAWRAQLRDEQSIALTGIEGGAADAPVAPAVAADREYLPLRLKMLRDLRGGLLN